MDIQGLLSSLNALREKHNFEPGDSQIGSAVLHPVDFAQRTGNWFNDAVTNAMGMPSQRQLADNPNPFWSPSVDQQTKAGIDLAGLAQTGAFPFAPDSSGGLLGTISKFGIPKKLITVNDPERVAYPNIYGRPDEIAARAATNTAPESPNLFDIFGVTRDDLYQMNKGRVGNAAPNVKLAANPKGSDAALNIMTPRNTNRLVDILSEAQQYPDLSKGMIGWYEMQPLYDRLTQISDNPTADFNRFQSFTGMASPMSDVVTELQRGTHALYGDNNGNFDQFVEFGGGKGSRPMWLQGNPGTVAHKTAHSIPMQKYVDTGDLQMESPKVPLYIQSAGVPETGFQTLFPVGDAHFSRGIGLADTRTNKDFGASISTPELQTIGDWWGKISNKAGGLNPVNGQGLLWGTLAPATGVKTAVGAPKLELIADQIAKTANALNIDPMTARDLILTGKLPILNTNLAKKPQLSDYIKK